MVVFNKINRYLHTRASAEKFPEGRGGNEKKTEKQQKIRKIALLSLFQYGGGNGKKDRKQQRKNTEK